MCVRASKVLTKVASGLAYGGEEWRTFFEDVAGKGSAAGGGAAAEAGQRATELRRSPKRRLRQLPPSQLLQQRHCCPHNRPRGLPDKKSLVNARNYEPCWDHMTLHVPPWMSSPCTHTSAIHQGIAKRCHANQAAADLHFALLLHKAAAELCSAAPRLGRLCRGERRQLPGQCPAVAAVSAGRLRAG